MLLMVPRSRTFNAFPNCCASELSATEVLGGVTVLAGALGAGGIGTSFLGSVGGFSGAVVEVDGLAVSGLGA